MKSALAKKAEKKDTYDRKHSDELFSTKSDVQLGLDLKANVDEVYHKVFMDEMFVTKEDFVGVMCILLGCYCGRVCSCQVVK